MLKSVSTGMVMMLWILRNQIPKLLHLVELYSQVGFKRDQVQGADASAFLSSESITIAKEHQSRVVLYGLSTVAKLYGAMQSLKQEMNHLKSRRAQLEQQATNLTANVLSGPSNQDQGEHEIDDDDN